MELQPGDEGFLGLARSATYQLCGLGPGTPHALCKGIGPGRGGCALGSTCGTRGRGWGWSPSLKGAEPPGAPSWHSPMRGPRVLTCEMDSHAVCLSGCWKDVKWVVRPPGAQHGIPSGTGRASPHPQDQSKQSEAQACMFPKTARGWGWGSTRILRAHGGPDLPVTASFRLGPQLLPCCRLPAVCPVP